MVASKKVKLLCEDKSSFCSKASEEQKCESDLAKLICRKSCNHCKCEDAESGFCQADDICGSQEGRFLCAKKCNACEFTMVDDDGEPKGPKEAELEKPKEDPEKEKEDAEKEEAKKAKEKEEEDARKAKEQVKEDAEKAKEIEEAEEKAREKEKEEAKKKEDADKKKEKEDDAKKAKEKGEQSKEELEPEASPESKDDEKNKDDKPAKDCLEFHNKYRENHEETPAMEWDEAMAKSAEEYAKKLAEDGGLKHSDRKDRDDAGENLAFRGGKYDNSVCQFGVASWYNEIKDFDFNTKKGAGTGHFTQVVWKKSTKLGCGVAKKGSREYLVCRYVEAGNMLGEYKEQVGGLKKDVTMDVIDSQIKDAGVSGKRRNHVSKLLRKPVIL